MKVTVIIPTCGDRPEFLKRAIFSVEQQTFKDLECLVIEDIERRGLAYVRNFGAESAQGDYVVTLDDDNEFSPVYLEKTVAFLDEHPEFAAVGVGRVVKYPEGRVYQPPPSGEYFPINDGYLIRRDCFLAVRCDEELLANEDADFGLRFLKRFKVGRIEEFLMRVQGSPIINTTSHTNYSDRHLAGMVNFWLKCKDDLPSKDRRHYQSMIGRMFLLASGQRWYRWGYIIEQKLKRYVQILW